MCTSQIDETCEELIGQIAKSGSAFVDSLRTTSKEPISLDKLIVCGMGGSGISADYVAKLAESTTDKRIVVNKNYLVPSYVDKSWDAVVISYSGNTEETLSCFDQLVKLGIEPVCITSNGKLLQYAQEQNLQYIQVPHGIAPRAAFPYLFGSLYGLIAETLDLPVPTPEEEEQLIATSDLQDKTSLNIFCKQVVDKFPIILFPTELSNVGLRFRCQLNENSKKSAAGFEVPEFSHNGIVGLDGIDVTNQAVILLRSDNEYDRTSIHLDFFRDNLEEVGLVHEFVTHGKSELEQHLRLTWLLDYVSVKLAQEQQVDPLGVPSIDKLKSILKDKM